MSTLLAILPIVPGGLGAAEDVSNLQAQKTLVLSNVTGSVQIEASVDGVEFVPVCTFVAGGPTDQTIDIVAAYMRVNAVKGNAATACAMAESGGVSLGVVPTPPANGAGADLDISEFGPNTTVFVTGLTGGSVAFEVSCDGVVWSTDFKTFTANGYNTKDISARFIRALGVGATGAIGIGVCSADVPETGIPQQVFDPVDIFIYARTTGDDVLGNGTLANPYRTMQRAVRDIPNPIPAGDVYRVDISGIGVEVLPEMYEFPAFVGVEGIGDFDFSQKYFHYYNAVNIQADPQLATGVAGITSIPLAGAVESTPKASTGLLRITSPGAGWIAGELKGKFAVGAGLATEHSVIWDNGVDWIDITINSSPTYPVEIMECSAELQATKDPGDLHRAAVNIKNSTVGLLGIKVSSLSAAAGSFGNWGLQTAGPLPISVQLCDIRGAGFVTTEWTRARNCYLPESLFLDAPLLLTGCYLDGSVEIVPAGPRVTVWGARGIDSLFRKTVIEGCTTMRFRDLFDTHESGSVPLVQMNFCQILNPLADFPPVLGVVEDGIYWTGAQLRLLGVDITRDAGDPLLGNGAAIRCKGNNALVVLRSVTGTGFALGCAVEDGGNAEQDDAGGVVTDIGSAVGANSFQSGSLPIEATWPVGVYPVSNFPDYAAPAAQGTRVWKRS
jgi:hypothetical protein